MSCSGKRRTDGGHREDDDHKRRRRDSIIAAGTEEEASYLHLNRLARASADEDQTSNGGQEQRQTDPERNIDHDFDFDFNFVHESVDVPGIVHESVDVSGIVPDRAVLNETVERSSNQADGSSLTHSSIITSREPEILRIACWNVGGMYGNHPTIFNSVRDIDISCFVETFLEDHTAPHLRIPNDAHALFVPGRRGPNSRRASGGFALLVKNNVARPRDCELVERYPGICVASIKLHSGIRLRIIVVYRAAAQGTPLYNPNFFVNLLEVLSDYGNDNLIVTGDFNTKMGDRSGPLGVLDFAGDVLPERAESTEVDTHAEDLFEVITSAQLYGIYDESGGVVQDTFLCRDGSGGGSLIDLFFVNDLLFPHLASLRTQFPCESNHALMVANLELDVLRSEEMSNPGGIKRVRLFDVARLSELEHTDGIRELARSTENFDIRSSLNTILDYVDQFTQVVRVRERRGRQETASAETTAARRDARLVERRMKVERDAEVRRSLRHEWMRMCEAWRALRDRDAQRSIEEARNSFYEAIANKNLYRAWKIARRNLSGKGGGIRDSVTSFISANQWEEHFAGLFAGNRATLIPPIRGNSSSILDNPFTGEEVSNVLDRKRNHRALGPDGFSLDHIRILRYDEITCSALANFMNICMAEADIPDEWGQAFLFILYKGSGPKDNANNFRGITLKSQLLKLLESLMCERLRKWAEMRGILPTEQLAYRPGHNGTDHLYSLMLLRDYATRRRQKLYAAFVDLRKAFPSVDRQRLLNKLSELGVSDSFLAMMTRLYSGDSFSILLDGVSTERSFDVHTGVHEGSPLSPLLFIMFIAGLTVELRRQAAADGLRLDCGTVILCLLYADDVLLLSPTHDGLQRLIHATCQFFSGHGLVVNPDNSDIVVFSLGRRPHPADFDIAGLDKNDITEAKYLGLIFSYDSRWKSQLETTLTRCRMARGRCQIICSSLKLNRAKAICQVFDTFVSSIYRYSLGVWGITAGDLRRIDNLFCDFIRKQYQLPQSSCRKGILMQFARRCASCDAYYLAAVHLARGLTSPDSVWGRVIATTWHLQSIPWVRALRTRLREMNLSDVVLRAPADFLGKRRDYSVDFNKWCHYHHLIHANGSSADLFRINRPFGMYPFLFDMPTHRARPALTLLLSCWRWSYDLRATSEYCRSCDCVVNSPHILFRCSHTARFREEFHASTGLEFHLDNFAEANVTEALVTACWKILNMLLTASPY